MKKKVLLVEYATASVDLIKEILSNPVFEIKVANEGEIAKKYLERQSFDLMITAAMLPKFHGFNLSQYAADTYPGMKIIIVSEIYKGMDYRHQALTIYKADDFFEKPFDKKAFKKRVYELLELEEEVLTGQAKVSTAEVPISDTKKIPTMKKLKEEGKTLTSEDLFGDIIQKVQEIPTYEIKLDADTVAEEDIAEVPPVTQELVPPVTQRIDKIKTPPKPPPVTQELKPQTTEKTQKIDLDLLNLVKPSKQEAEKDKRKFKKIEDDISRRLEDTLSGLGVSSKPSAGAAKKPEKPTESTRKMQTPPVVKKEPEIIDDDEKTDEIKVGGYEILGQIGRGGMAEIYKAKKKGVKGFEKVIALKKILSGYGTDAKYIEMFVDEAKIAAELSHPNIVQIYDLGKKDDYYFIAMEYVSGKDLRVILQKLFQKGETMPEELAIYLIIKVLEALNYAHAARDSRGNNLDIVHRDVSPPNILVSYDGNIKLTDFGVSKASTKMHQTLAGALKGKLLYMSPEQAKGEGHIDYRSDLYSVGIILFELITGEKLFLGSSEMGTLKKVQEGRIIKPSQIKKDIEPELETIIIKALNRDMNKRYQQASHMIKDLDAYMTKYYNNMPEAAHIALFIYHLFKEEIIKAGIEINLSALHPSPIIKKSKKEEKVPEKGIPELPEEDQLEELAKALQPREEIVEAVEQDLAREEEFQPIIEINFDEDKAVPSPAPSLAEFEARPRQRDTKKQKNLLVIFSIAIAVLAIAIVLLLTLGSGDRTSEAELPPQTMQEPVTTTSESGETGETPLPTGHTSTEVVSSQPELKPGEEEKPSQQEPKSTVSIEDSGSDSSEPASQKPGKKAEAVKKQVEETPTKKEKKPPAQEEKTQESQTPQQDIGEEAGAKPVEAKPEKPTEEVKKEPTTIEQKPPVKEGDILTPGQVDTQAEPISTPKIRITHSIRRLLTSDQRILVSYLVDHNGNVEIVKVLSKSSIKRLNSLITETIKKWKYKPATKNNIRVKVWKNQWIVIQK